MATIQTLIAIATQHNWTVYHADIPNAYLNGTLDHIIITRLPEGWNTACGDALSKDGDLVILLKALYGTPDTGRHWNIVINEILISLDLKPSVVEPCMYTYNDANGITIIVLWVDDIFYTGNNNAFISYCIQQLTI